MWVGLALCEVGVFSASSGDVAGFESRLGCAAGVSMRTSAGFGASVDTWPCAGTGSGVEETRASWSWS